MTAATGLVAPVEASGSPISIGNVVRIALLCAGEADLVAARRVALASCADTVLVQTASERLTIVERATALRDARADAVLLAGDAEDLVETIRLAYGTSPHPVVLVAAGDRPRERAVAALAGLAAQAMAPATSAYGRDALVARLRAMRRETSDAPLRDEALEAAARSLAITTARSVVIVDVESEATTLAYASAAGSSFAVSAHVGVGANGDRVVARAGLERVRRWMPRAVDAPALLDRVFNRARWPKVAPSAPLTIALEMALARESIAHVIAEAGRAGVDMTPLRAASTIVCSGAPVSWPLRQQCVMTVIDALEPTGVHAIVRDEGDALVRAGALAARGNADVTTTLRPMAIAASLWPKRAFNVTVVDAGGPVDAKVSRGALVLVPTHGAVELRVNGAVEATASELELGVILDARGRPLVLPPRDAERIPTLARWTSAMGVLPDGAS